MVATSGMVMGQLLPILAQQAAIPCIASGVGVLVTALAERVGVAVDIDTSAIKKVMCKYKKKLSIPFPTGCSSAFIVKNLGKITKISARVAQVALVAIPVAVTAVTLFSSVLHPVYGVLGVASVVVVSLGVEILREVVTTRGGKKWVCRLEMISTFLFTAAKIANVALAAIGAFAMVSAMGGIGMGISAAVCVIWLFASIQTVLMAISHIKDE